MGRACGSRTPTRRSSTTWPPRGLLVRRGALHPLLPPLLAVRHAAHLLGQDVVVRAHVATTGPTCCGRTSTSTGTPSTSSTAASATGWRTTSTGPCPATGTGARRCPSGAATRRATTRASARSRSCRGWPGRDLAGLDLHRPAVDDVAFPCPADGLRRRRPAGGARARRLVRLGRRCRRPSTTTRSATRPSSETAFPADFICEAIDQTRGWFYSLLAVNTLVFGSTPYRNVVCLAHVVDEFGAEDVEVEGQRPRPVARLRHLRRRRPALVLLLRRLAVDQPAGLRGRHPGGHPQDAASPCGTSSPSSPPTPTSTGGSRSRGRPASRRATGTRPPTPTGHVLDRWAEARLAQTVAAVTDALDDFDALGGATALAAFVDDLSNWYVRRSRPRFWGPAGGASDPGAHATLYRCLTVVSQLLAPFCPFLADELYVHAHRRGVGAPAAAGPTCPIPTRPTPACWPRWTPPAAWSAWAGRPAPTPASAPASRCAGPCVLHPGVDLSDEVRAQIADELNVQGHRGRGDAVRPHVVDGGPQLPGPRAPARATGQRGEEGAGRGRRVGDPPPAGGRRLRGGGRRAAGGGRRRGAGQQPRGLRPGPRRRLGRGPRPRARRRPASWRAWPASWPATSTTCAGASGLSLSDRIEVVVEGGPRLAAGRWPPTATGSPARSWPRRWSWAPTSADAATYDVDGDAVRVDLRVAG